MSDTMTSFTNFRDGLSGKMTQLRRRFSQGEMQDDEAFDQQQQATSANPSPNLPLTSTNAGSQNQSNMYNSNTAAAQASSAAAAAASQLRDRPNMSLNLNSTSPSMSPGSQPVPGGSSAGGPPGSSLQQQQQHQQMQMQQQQRAIPKTTSAPSSPTKTYTPANIARSIFRQVSQSTTNLVQQTVAGVSGAPREKAKILLVIDDQHTDWSKYFRGRRIQNEWEIRIEQAEFNEVNMAAFSDRGTMVDMEIMRGGTKVVRSFRPDFVLIRQPVRDANRDYRHFLLALMYGNVPSVNSLDSLYTFLDKPLIFSQLIQIQQRLGKEKFPLIQQSFYPNHREMLTSTSFPVVIKIGHAHAGLGKTRVDNHYDFQDVASLVGSCGAYCSVEPFIESKYDLHLQKIGPSYKAFIRKSISGSWKANIGSSMLEQVPLQEKHKIWLDECSRLFGGLDFFAIEVLTAKDGQEYIIGLNDSSAMGLLGETQEEDRQLIAEIVFRKMDVDANRRRFSQTAGAMGPPQPMDVRGQQGPPQSAPGTQAVPNGYPGAPVRRESRDGPAPQSSAPRDRDQTLPYSGRPGDRPGPSSTSGPFSRDPTARDPPMRDPRDSNIRDVSSVRDTREPGSAASREPNMRETPSREPGVGPTPISRRESEASRTSSFSSGTGTSGYSSAGYTAPPSMERRQMSQSNINLGGPPCTSANGPGAVRGMGPGPGSQSMSAMQQQQQQSLGGGPRLPNSGDTDDTMSNLKRTFAGIFGDM